MARGGVPNYMIRDWNLIHMIRGWNTGFPNYMIRVGIQGFMIRGWNTGVPNYMIRGSKQHACF